MNNKAVSAKSYELELPKVPSQKEVIMNLIIAARIPVTREMLAKWTKFKHNVITARLNALVNEDVKIKENTPTISQSTGKEVITYSAFSTPEERIEQIYRFRGTLVKEREDLEEDFHSGKLKESTLEMVKHRIQQLNKRIKKLESL